MYRYMHFLNYTIPSYGLCMMIAVVLCGFFITKRARKNGISLEDIIIIMAVSLAGALIAGSIFYTAVSYTPKQIFDFIRNGEFAFVLNGGLVFYGGLIGGIIGAMAAAKILHVAPGALTVSAVPYLPLGHAIGRIGCLLAGCCYGFRYEGIFAVTSPYAVPAGSYFPIQAVESVLNLIIMVVLLLYAKKRRNGYDTLCLYLVLYAVMRFIGEFFRGDAVRGQLLGLSASQWISLVILFFLCTKKLLFMRSKNIHRKERI